MNLIIEIIFILFTITVFIWLWWDFSPLKCLLIAIINAIYGVMLILTLTINTPGFYLVLIIGSILTLMGLVGFIFWIRRLINISQENNDDTNIKGWFSLVRSFDIVLIIGLLFRIIILQPYIVEGSSMEPNFQNREIMLVDKLSYRFNDPNRGDVVIFHAPKNPGEDYIKRVIGIPGETVVIGQGKIYVDGKKINESYLPTSTKTENGKNTDFFRQTLGPDEYFVLGDNRNNSSDSREWGVLPKINIVGKAWYILLPWNSHGFIKHNSPTILQEQLLQNVVSFNFFLLTHNS